MTNTSPEPSERPNILNRLGMFIKKPSTLIVGGIVVTLGVVGYAGIQFFVYQKLSPLLESQLSNYLKRDVKVGQVESFSFNHLRIGESSVPATATDPDTLSIKAIDVGFNPLPLLLGRPLPLNITIVDPNVYIEQDKTGKWIAIELPTEKKEPPIKVDAKIKIEDGDIDLKPYQAKKALNITVEGDANYQQVPDQQVQYDLNVAILRSTLTLKGETLLKTGKTQVDLTINRLALGELISIFPSSSIKVNGGEVNGNISVDVPSSEQKKKTRGRGRLILGKIAARLPSLQVPIQAKAQFSLEGQKVIIDSFEASLSTIVAQVTGEIDLEKGYNIDIEVKPFNVSRVARVLSIPIPRNIDGEIELKINITGPFAEPVITGTINNDKPIRIDKLILKDFTTKFETDLNQFVVKKIQIKPAAGGEITGNGQIKLDILQALEKNQPINWTKFPLSFTFKANLPTQNLIAPYVKFSPDVKIGNITADIKLRGIIAKPEALLKWQAANMAKVAEIGISGSGEMILRGQNIILNNNILETDGGQITLTGNANLKQKQWQTVINARGFKLDPFLSAFCGSVVSLCSYTNKLEPVQLVRANIRLSGSLNNFNLDKIDGLANLALTVKNGTIGINSQLSQGIMGATVLTSNISLDPFLTNVTVPVNLTQSKVNILGSVNQIISQKWDKIQATADLRLTVANSPVTIISRIDQGIVQGIVNTNQIMLTEFIPNLSIPVSLAQSQINFSGSVKDMLALDLRNFMANSHLNLTIANSPVTVISNIENGILKAWTRIRQLSLNELVPKLAIPTQLISSDVDLTANIESLIISILNAKPDLSSIKANINLQLAIADGTVKAATQLNNNQWRSNIIASNLNISSIFTGVNFTNADAHITLGGNLNSLLQGKGTLPIQVQAIALKANGQNLNAKGDILLTNLLNNPDIAQVNLEVKANTNLDILPLTQFLTLVPINRQLLPEQLQLGGKAQFQGSFKGKNLLTAPTQPGNIQLAGNLTLTDLIFNNRAFESKLSGTIKAELGQPLSINLQGKEDIIAAVVEPCQQSKCLFPYLPVSFELRQVTGKLPPIIVEGKREGDRFLAQIKTFPLELLNITPGVKYGLISPLKGEINMNLDINLFTLATQGEITVKNPSINNIKATSFKANFAYNNQIAQLTAATLELNRSIYNVQGSINTKTGAIEGNLNINDGYIEDVLTALGNPNIHTVLNWIDEQPLIKNTGLKPVSVGDPNNSLAAQINLFTQIEQRIREIAAQREKLGIPTELNFQGQYKVNLSIAGTIKQPQVNLQFQGEHWTWYPQQSYPNIVEPLGLVIQNTQVIPINEIILKANFENGIVKIAPSRLQIKDTVLSLAGKYNFLTGEIGGDFSTEKLSLDTVRNFVAIPVDINGDLNSQGSVTGTITAPKIEGQFAFVDTVINARLVNHDIKGKFNYTDARFQVATDNSPFLQLYASIPYPTKPENDQAKIRLKLGKDALELVEIFTQDQLDWISGEGDVNLEATGQVEIAKQVKLSNLAVVGTINLKDATIKSKAFPVPLTVNGQIGLTHEYINIQQLNATFADSQIAIAGILPLFESPNGNLANPLTIALEKNDINLEGLYKGTIDGKIVITGSALKPMIGGEILLSNGQVFVPRINLIDIDNQKQSAKNLVNQWVTSRQSNILISAPKLNNFRVNLQELSLVQDPLYAFGFGGELILNGDLDNINNIRPQGVINLVRGRVSFLDDRFLLNRRHQNKIVFQPEQGIFNPYLNIQMRTILSQFPQALRERRPDQSNEIPDDSLIRIRRVDVILSIDGQLSQLFPGFGQDLTKVCQILPRDLPIPSNPNLTEVEFKKLSNCIQSTLPKRGTNGQLLTNSALKFTSTPPLSEGEIIRLLEQQLFDFVNALQGDNTAQLIEYGVTQLGVAFVTQAVLYDIENSISNAIQATEFRVLPFVEAVYRVDKQGFIRVSYDYNFNEVTVRYETRF